VDRIMQDCYAAIKSGTEIEDELDADISTFFHRCVIDKCGTINSPEELDNLCINIAYKYSGYVTMPDTDEITKFCHRQSITASTGWDLEAFTRWFNSRLRYAKTVREEKKSFKLPAVYHIP
jgi:hypothetical protein